MRHTKVGRVFVRRASDSQKGSRRIGPSPYCLLGSSGAGLRRSITERVEFALDGHTV